MNFREIGLGRFFPPIIPNGRFFALAIGDLRIQEILQVTDVGLECGGVLAGVIFAATPSREMRLAC